MTTNKSTLNEIIQSTESVFNIQRYPVTHYKTFILPNGLFYATVTVDVSANNSKSVQNGILRPFKRTFMGKPKASKA